MLATALSLTLNRVKCFLTLMVMQGSIMKRRFLRERIKNVPVLCAESFPLGTARVANPCQITETIVVISKLY